MLKQKIYFKKNIYATKRHIMNVYTSMRKMVVHNWPEKTLLNRLYA